MLIRGTPKVTDRYIRVNSEVSKQLHLNGFFPDYMDNEYIYYQKTNRIIEFLKEENLIWN